MSSPARSRARRAVPAPSGPTVAVTGASSALGALVTERLVARVGAEVGRVLAVDTVRGAATGATWRVGALDTPAVADLLRGADVVVLLAPAVDLQSTLTTPVAERREQIVRRAQAVTTGAAAVGARRLIAVTSAMVLISSDITSDAGPSPLPDDAPVLALPDAGAVGDLVEVEQVLARVPRAHPGLAVTVLRPTALVGPDVDTVVSRHFEAPRLLALRESEMTWQFCHVDDLAEAVAVAVAAELDGSLTVGAPGVMSQPEIETLSGMRRVELTQAMAFSTAERLHRIGVLPAPASDLAYVVRPWAVSSQRLVDAGWSPTYDNQTCLGVLLDEVSGHHAVASRRLDRKDAALGAAGAAVALVGTAAIVRRRRRRDGGS